MPLQIASLQVHPQGEASNPLRTAAQAVVAGSSSGPLHVDTHGRRFHVEWDPQAPVTALGQLVFFSQFLATAGLFSQWVKSCPLKFTSPNAPSLTDLLGTSVLAALCGHRRYCHVTALRGDTINPQGLGMSKVCSEDSVRRAFQEADPLACALWQQQSLQQTYLPGLHQPWIMDLDVTIKPIFGHQEGAQIGYNPHKPGRPSHAYHTAFVRGLRLVLDVEVHGGKEHSAGHGRQNLWRLWQDLPKECRPWMICGDSAYGHEALLAECELRQQLYLFRVRQTKGVKQLIKMLEQSGGWHPLSQGFEGIEGSLKLTGWTATRRVVVLRRPLPSKPVANQPMALPWAEEICVTPQYEYQVLATNWDGELLSVASLYRQRADAENVYDELKNQWGWGGFMTRDLQRCQIAARTAALVYNWWNLFVRCAEPQRPREAITSRPLLLCAVGRVVESSRQMTLRLTSSHAEASRVQGLLTGMSLFLSGLQNSAEQLNSEQRWQRIWTRILAPFLHPAATLGPPCEACAI